MAEEKIRILGAKNPCENCKLNPCPRKCMFGEMYEYAPGMTRQEAIEKIAKAICKISCACKYYACGNCTEFLEHYTPDLAEAALNALLGE